MFQSISHEPERVTGSHLVRLVGKDQAVILSSPSSIFILFNSARKNPNTSANPHHLDLLPVHPAKRRALADAQAKLENASTKLKVVKDLVAELSAKLKKLTDEFDAANKEKNDAIAIVENGQTKLSLATRLTNALGSEGVRWKANIEQMEASRDLLVGDVLLASAFLSYIISV